MVRARHGRAATCYNAAMKIGPTEILDTYAEAFGARFTRLIITAADEHWLDAALRSITGHGTNGHGRKSARSRPASRRTLRSDLPHHCLLQRSSGRNRNLLAW